MSDETEQPVNGPVSKVNCAWCGRSNEEHAMYKTSETDVWRCGRCFTAGARWQLRSRREWRAEERLFAQSDAICAAELDAGPRVVRVDRDDNVIEEIW